MSVDESRVAEYEFGHENSSLDYSLSVPVVHPYTILPKDCVVTAMRAIFRRPRTWPRNHGRRHRQPT
jgi:hypothetical protein